MGSAHIQSDADYAAMVENLDANVGRLADAVDRLGKTGNTSLPHGAGLAV